MRAANFKMGSILPETNSYRPAHLERNNSGEIGLSKSPSGYIPQNRGNMPVKSQAVSAGNNIAMGSGHFQTVN